MPICSNIILKLGLFLNTNYSLSYYYVTYFYYILSFSADGYLLAIILLCTFMVILYGSISFSEWSLFIVILLCAFMVILL